jgi:hypothetical protein
MIGTTPPSGDKNEAMSIASTGPDLSMHDERRNIAKEWLSAVQ